MNPCQAVILCFTFAVLVTGCNPSNPTGAETGSSVQVGVSGSVRINGQPVARAAAGSALLASECAGVLRSPDVRINGEAALVIPPEAAAACRAAAGGASSANVKIGD